jgi:hypothetical protein
MIKCETQLSRQNLTFLCNILCKNEGCAGNRKIRNNMIQLRTFLETQLPIITNAGQPAISRQHLTF